MISVHVSFYFTMFPSPTQNLSDQTHGFLPVETFKEFPLKSLSPQIGHFKDFKGILSPVASSPLSQLWKDLIHGIYIRPCDSKGAFRLISRFPEVIVFLRYVSTPALSIKLYGENLKKKKGIRK